jgi:FtsP/CotA-like multicopper oxidase with cupredoxin domain
MNEAGVSALQPASEDDSITIDSESNTYWKFQETESLLPSETLAQSLQNGGRKSAEDGPLVSRSQKTRLVVFFAVFAITVGGFLLFFTALIGPCGFLNTTKCLLQEQQEQQEQQKPRSFRRPQTDYVLDPNWDFNAEPRTRYYHFTVSDMVVNPDGVYRPMILINSQFPGPLIECNDGDKLVIEVENKSVNSTAFHWHGLYQNGSNWMDGTIGVTQCPIAPGGNFTYEFTIKGQHGTYW